MVNIFDPLNICSASGGLTSCKTSIRANPLSLPKQSPSKPFLGNKIYAIDNIQLCQREYNLFKITLPTLCVPHFQPAARWQLYSFIMHAKFKVIFRFWLVLIFQAWKTWISKIPYLCIFRFFISKLISLHNSIELIIDHSEIFNNWLQPQLSCPPFSSQQPLLFYMFGVWICDSKSSRRQANWKMSHKFLRWLQ